MILSTRISRLLGQLAICTAIAVAWTNLSSGETIHLSPDQDWFSVLSGSSLKPGDEVVLSDGLYSDRRRLALSHRGTQEHPIVIRGENRQPAAVFHRPDAKQNSLHLEGCQYLILRDLEITGGAAGIRIGGREGIPAKNITLENLHIHHVGGVAVTANYPGHVYEALTFRRNHIHHTSGHGEGFYLGSNNKADGSTNGYLFDSIIENNYIHHLNGDDVSQGDGIELKDGSYGNIVRDNVIHDTNYPGILVYGTDGRAPNVIERNVIWNSGDHGIQAASEAIIRHNVIRETMGAGIYCKDHQSATVGSLRIVANTILADPAIRITAPRPYSGPIEIIDNVTEGEIRVPHSDTVDSANVRLQKNSVPALTPRMK